jgi:hypothetical protein
MNEEDSNQDDSSKETPNNADSLPDQDVEVRGSLNSEDFSADTPPEEQIVQNRDIKNSIRLCNVHGLHDRVEELRIEIQESLDRESMHPLGMPFGDVGIGLFEIHALSLSFFEAASMILFDWALEVDAEPTDTMLSYYQNEHQYRGRNILTGSEGREEAISIVSDHIQENGTAGQYQSILLRAGIIEKELHDRIYEVREKRNEFVHQPQSMIEIDDKDKMLSCILACSQMVNQVLDTVEEEVPTNTAFYPYFVEQT